MHDLWNQNSIFLFTMHYIVLVIKVSTTKDGQEKEKVNYVPPSNSCCHPQTYLNTMLTSTTVLEHDVWHPAEPVNYYIVKMNSHMDKPCLFLASWKLNHPDNSAILQFYLANQITFPNFNLLDFLDTPLLKPAASTQTIKNQKYQLTNY